MAAPQMKIVAVLRRALKLTPPKIALLTAVMLAVPASALAAAPAVNITRYSKAISGNIGATGATGVTAVAYLVRGNCNEPSDNCGSMGTPVQGDNVIDQTPAAPVSSSDGSWSTSFPNHAPGDGNDTVVVTYPTGTGAPPSATYGSFSFSGLSFNMADYIVNVFGQPNGGATITVNCPVSPCPILAVSGNLNQPGPTSTPLSFTYNPGPPESFTASIASSPGYNPSDTLTLTVTVPTNGSPSWIPPATARPS